MIEIRGYAVPFDRTRHIASAGHVEVFDHDAFADMIGRSVPLVWDSHDDGAPELGTATLFADDYGLAFFAAVDMERHRGRIAAMTRKQGPADQCSIGGLRILSDRSDVVRGIACQRITKASIDHIAIVDDAAYGKATAAWPTHDSLDHAPWRIQELAARWDKAHALYQLESRRAWLVATADSIAARVEGPGGELSDKQLKLVKSTAALVAAVDKQIAELRAA